MRIVITAYVKPGHTMRFTRCVECIDTKLVAAIVGVNGGPICIPSTADVDSNMTKEIHTTLARLSERQRSDFDAVANSCNASA